MRHHYTPTSPEIRIDGALYLEPVGNALRPHRLSQHLLDRVPNDAMRAMVATSAGVRAVFTTTATRIGVHLAAHPIEIVGLAPPFTAFVDLVVDGKRHHSAPVHGNPARLDNENLDLSGSDVLEIIFDGLTPHEKTIEIWFPHTAIVDLWGISTNAPIAKAPADIRPRWIHHGSSISHCLEAPQPTATWPAISAFSLGYHLIDLAYAGNAQLDPFIARTIRDTPADLITLKLGINNINADSMRMRTFVPAVQGFLDLIRDGHPTTPIQVISPIACPAVETTPGPTGNDPVTGKAASLAVAPHPPGALTLATIRAALFHLVQDRQRSDNALHYLDGRELFSPSDAAHGHLPDGLHPDADGYRMMGNRFAALERKRTEALHVS